MDAKQFIASLVSSLAWPSAVVVLAWMFRKQMARLLSAPVTRLKAGPSGLELEFDRELERTALKVEATVVPTSLPEPTAASSTVDDLFELAEKQPPAAVLVASARLEAQLRDLLRSHGDDAGAQTTRGMIWLARRAAERSLIADDLVGVLRDMAFLRNLAAHGHMTPDAESAREYLDMAAQVSAAIERGPDHPPTGTLAPAPG